MLIVGLTGGIGSGKSTVANHFADLGVDLIDADEIAREVVQTGTPALAQIAEHFGTEILTPNGELKRRELRKIIFSSLEEKQWLEALLHPLINQGIAERIQQTRSPYCLLVSPLLIETAQRELVDHVLVIDVPESVQLQRTQDRDGSDIATIQAIIESQSSREQRLEQADDVLDNNLPLASLPERVEILHRKFLNLATLKNQSD